MCRFPALQYLDVSACRRVTDDELANLSKMPNLRTVVLSGCDDISDEGMHHLAQLTKLTYLYMSNCCKVSAVSLRQCSHRSRHGFCRDRDRWHTTWTCSL